MRMDEFQLIVLRGRYTKRRFIFVSFERNFRADERIKQETDVKHRYANRLTRSREADVPFLYFFFFFFFFLLFFFFFPFFFFFFFFFCAYFLFLSPLIISVFDRFERMIYVHAEKAIFVSDIAHLLFFWKWKKKIYIYV